MNPPDTTYRVQLSPQFTFQDLDRILDYLDDLGISTIYSAPIFQARKGSLHGYDVMDPFTINTEIGTLQEFKAIGKRMKKKGMSWIQDIVPNHMAFDSKNPWLKDIFEIGKHSKFYNYFDIDWNFRGLDKLITPFLGTTLEEALKNNEINLKLEEDGIFIEYFKDQYPVNINTYIEFLTEAEELVWLKRFREFAENVEQWRELKTSFFKEVSENPNLRQMLVSQIDRINSSVEQLKKILDLQNYLLTHWQKTETEINYRRFFTINGLICLRMEDPEVFETYHTFVKELCDEGLIHGLRIDHIDGLFDPGAYLTSLRELMGDNFYIIVEKILEFDEKLPRQWPVQGTSGYDFLAQVNHLLTHPAGEEEFTLNYDNISPKIPEYESLVYQKKIFILQEKMGGELHNLWMLLKSKLPNKEIPDEKSWKGVLAAFLAAFPVYRIYPEHFPLKPKQVQILETAYKKAVEECPVYKRELNYLKDLYFGEAPKESAAMLYFLQRCQQYSGPLAAKGVEDTSFYIFNRLIAHNEVGDSPENFGLSRKEFHQKMQRRNKDYPRTINTTATHDTKRGEDARMRLLVLSEIPAEWFTMVSQWKEITANFRKEKNIPDKNEEYFIYQALLGSMPLEEEKSDDFLGRTNEYLKKVLREAKIHSNWGEPDEVYENSVFEFVTDILGNETFRNSFDPFLTKVAGWGAIKSLSQTLIKITAPGIPDVYQGTELWDLSYVDPDNRRPVDYAIRTNYMADFRAFSKSNLKKKNHTLKINFSTGKIKMYVLFKTLLKRRREKEIFQKGDYLPLTMMGKAGKNFIAYARILGEEWRIILVPIYVSGIFDHETLKPRNGSLFDLYIKLPEDAPTEWDFVFTGQSIITEGKIPLQDCISEFPVAIIKNPFKA